MVTADAGAPTEPRTTPLLVRAALVALVVVGAFSLLGHASAISDQEPLDLSINLVAGERLLDRAPLYETGPDVRARAVELGGPSMDGAFTEPTNSFVGPPSTALVHVPFTRFDHATGVALFRGLALLGMVGSIGLVARGLSVGRRLDGSLLGTGVLLVASATRETLLLGQGHELVMLGLALALWGTSRERWGWVGVGLGLATVLKISPVLLLVYLVVRGRRQVIPGFLASSVGLTLAAAAVGRPLDLLVWLRDVAPEISAGVSRTINQSLPALVTRLSAPAADLGADTDLGAIRLLAVPLAITAAGPLWRNRRGRAIDPMELGLLVLVGLALGPLTWMHYATWACLPLVLLADPRRWVGRDRTGVIASILALVTAVALLALTIGHPTEAAVRADAALRVTTSPGLLAVLLLLAVCATRLVDLGPHDSETTGPGPPQQAEEAVVAPLQPALAPVS